MSIRQETRPSPLSVVLEQVPAPQPQFPFCASRSALLGLEASSEPLPICLLLSLS